ncbi:ras-related GTP-binding protein [Trypanosoma grayi]|uniref:ras-related GTP-binding protein n=1 Tax=Trypanosoma grayi TaxID=71804 RepID=UPI0004F4ADD5|nr:ras-related GTP-binding protein [Trypanosoma grayi]KEG09670.1 ras-related GTP-binding protein [Trypanosoma grayi]
MCFSLSDRRTFDVLQHRCWKEEAVRAFAVLAQDVAEARRHAVWPVTPVVVVGFASPGPGATTAVTHAEAVELARQMGASKYVEIAPGNTHHARSLTTQCLQVTHVLDASLTTAAAAFLAAAKWQMLQCHLRVPKPHVEVDVAAMRLQLDVTPGIAYVLTADGSDPRRNASRAALQQVPSNGVFDLRLYRKQPGTLLRICGMARCAYASALAEVEVPSAVPPPCGYFDAALRQFVVVSNGIPFTLRDVRYTLNGTAPTTASPSYIQPIELDTAAVPEERPWGPWRGSAAPPRVIRLTAFADDEFASPTVTYDVPAVLETPKVVYSPHDSTVSLESTHPMVEYRYTLDGTTPTQTSALYTGPLSLAAATTRQVRFVAFPKVFFPSREAVFYVPRLSAAAAAAAARHEDQLGSSFHTTKAAMMRGQHAVRKLRTNSNSSRNVDKENEHAGVATKSPASSLQAVSPRLRTEARAALCRHRSRSSNSNKNSSTAANRSVEGAEETRRRATPQQTRSCRRRRHPSSSSSTQSAPASLRRERPKTAAAKTDRGDYDNDDDSLLLMMPAAEDNADRDSRSRSEKRVGEGGVNGGQPAAVAGTATGAPLCTADGNTVMFDFPQPISLSYITVATPGGGAGPTSYEVEVKHAHGMDFLAVGSGELRDMRGVQTMKVLISARLFPIDRVRCVFSGGAAGFRVKDLKVHGKPFV